MPPRKLPKLHCGGRDVKTGSCSSFCTDQRNNHCDNLIQQTAARMLPVYTKMYGDTHGRLQKTLRILRACRLFNYRFIAQTDHLALEEELNQLPTIPKCYQLILALTQELPGYKARADAQVFPSLISQSLIQMHLCSRTTYPSLPSGLCLKRPAR